MSGVHILAHAGQPMAILCPFSPRYCDPIDAHPYHARMSCCSGRRQQGKEVNQVCWNRPRQQRPSFAQPVRSYQPPFRKNADMMITFSAYAGCYNTKHPRAATVVPDHTIVMERW